VPAGVDAPVWHATIETQFPGECKDPLNILAIQIETHAHLRHGKAQNNFPTTLPPHDSDMAVQVFKDPYLFDFLGTDAPRRETELERGLIGNELR
jgi:predicted nuclease of restriction endonuclease-like (RecB) superfamily